MTTKEKNGNQITDRTLYADAARTVHSLSACPAIRAPGEPCPDCLTALADLDALRGNAELFSVEDVVPWLREWQDMPEYTHCDLEPRYQVLVSFATAADVAEFAKAIGQKFSENGAARQLRSIWFPEQEIWRYANKRYVAR